MKQARFSELDREIVKHCIIYGRSQAEAAAYVDRDRKTVCRHMHYITERARVITQKLNTEKKRR